MRKWIELNDKLREASEDEAKEYLDRAYGNGRPKWFLQRIYCRYNKMRSIRERKELGIL